MKPAVLMAALLALAGSPPEREQPDPRRRCRFCKAPLSGALAATDGSTVHPANNCRYGEKGLFAVPVADTESMGVPDTVQLTAFVVGQRVQVLPPVEDVETESECLDSDFAGEWEIFQRGRDTDGVWHYKLRRPGEDGEPLIVQHKFLVAA